MSYENELAFATELAYEAGKIARKHFASDIGYENKNDNSPVTIADTEINELVIQRCSERYPDVGILGEEASRIGRDKNRLWVCDPIDGTISYTLGIPASTFCLAYVVDGVPEVGVVYDFNNEQMFSAIRGGGALLNGKPMQSSSGDTMRLINLEWYHAAKFNLEGVREKLFKQSYQVPNYASCSFIAMRVAMGRIAGDIYSGDKAWDVAAAKVIVEACGGTVTDLSGQGQRYDDAIKGAIIARPEYFDLIAQSLRQ